MWPVLGSLAVGGLFVWLLVHLVRLHELLRQAERDARLDDRIADRVMRGTSASWNDEDRAQLGGRPVFDATRSRKG